MPRKRIFSLIVSGALCIAFVLALSSQAVSQRAGGPGEVVGRVDSAVVERDDLVEFLIHTRGLDAMLQLMQLKIAEQLASEAGIEISNEMVTDEVNRTLDLAFADEPSVTRKDYPVVIDKVLAQRSLSRAEFDVIMRTNAALRALAAPKLSEQISDEILMDFFNQRYGEQVLIRHIAVANLQDVAKVKDRLAAGESFAKIAQEVSLEPTFALEGGLMPPFTRTDAGIPAIFKETAFGLEVGDVSDAIEAGGYFHIIRLERRIAPKAVKFENVKDDLKAILVEQQAQTAIELLRERIADIFETAQLEIADPVLRKQLQDRLAASRTQPLDEDELKRQMEQERNKGGNGATTRQSGGGNSGSSPK